MKLIYVLFYCYIIFLILTLLHNSLLVTISFFLFQNLLKSSLDTHNIFGEDFDFSKYKIIFSISFYNFIGNTNMLYEDLRKHFFCKETELHIKIIILIYIIRCVKKTTLFSLHFNLLCIHFEMEFLCMSLRIFCFFICDF